MPILGFIENSTTFLQPFVYIFFYISGHKVDTEAWWRFLTKLTIFLFKVTILLQEWFKLTVACESIYLFEILLFSI